MKYNIILQLREWLVLAGVWDNITFTLAVLTYGTECSLQSYI